MISKGSGSLQGNLVDIHQREIYFAEIQFKDGVIQSMERLGMPLPNQPFIVPGLVDAHIHIESSMLTPYEFAKKALVHGTIATVSDPHEIANVCGMEGIFYMIENAQEAHLKCCFGAPSCVPATAFETAGDTITANDVETLLSRQDILYLSEMMNYPGVLFKDPEVMQKIAIAKNLGKPIDGHAPGLMGEQAIQYIQAGITTDHECFTLEEALHKVQNGMKILIREGSAARNFDALHPLIASYPEMVMFCSDDKHPDELMQGHINTIVKRAVALGYDLFDVIRCASLNPIMHYNIPAGCLRLGDPADFILTENLEKFEISATYIDGNKVSEKGKSHLPEKNPKTINRFQSNTIREEELVISVPAGKIKVMEAIDGQLVTKSHQMETLGGILQSDVENDILKLVVVNRYRKSQPAIAFIKNIGIKKGAFASTVAHDSHNIIAVGTNDHDLASAINALMQSQGGLSVCHLSDIEVLPLTVAGLMSTASCEEVAAAYLRLDKKVKSLGCELRAPFMTLSFMALLVIPELKLSDRGLFDAKNFKLVGLEA